MIDNTRYNAEVANFLMEHISSHLKGYMQFETILTYISNLYTQLVEYCIINFGLLYFLVAPALLDDSREQNYHSDKYY